MNILLTGPNGFVGARIRDAMTVIPAPSLRTLGEDDVRRLVDRAEPDVIIHTAAVSDIGACAADPEGSRRANVDLPLWLVGTGVKCVLYSTDQVYSGFGEGGPFREDEISPANLYAEEKLEMERRALELNPDTVLLRATWMYDMPRYGSPNRGNFLVNMLRANGGEIALSSTEMRGLTYVREVAEHMKEAVSLPGGVYNYGSETDRSVMELGRLLAEEAGLRVTIREAGPRRNLWMDTGRLNAAGIVFRSSAEGLRQCCLDYSLGR